jgi:hypothetical protein
MAEETAVDGVTAAPDAEAPAPADMRDAPAAKQSDHRPYPAPRDGWEVVRGRTSGCYYRQVR